MSTTLQPGWARESLGGANLGYLTRHYASVERVLDAVATAFGLEKREQLLRRHRRADKGHLEARRIAMALLHEMTDLSLPRIAVAFGYADHTSVMHHLAVVKSREVRDVDYATVLYCLRQELMQ